MARDDWLVLIPGVHVGYIDWPEYERNQVTLQHNAGAFANDRRGSVPREGVGLLQGRILCGYCGARMRERYQQVSGHQAPYYQCTEASVRHAGKLCQSIRGQGIDDAISALLLETVSPAALEVALAVQDEVDRIHQADAVREAQLERTRYEAELARRRYLRVDPNNRWSPIHWKPIGTNACTSSMGCSANWITNGKPTGPCSPTMPVSESPPWQKTSPRVWRDSRTTPVERKWMVALLLEDVTLIKGDIIAVHVRFRGGRTQSLTVPRPVSMARVHQTPLEVVETLDRLLDTCTDREAAEHLNAHGFRNWQGQPFTTKKVALVRRTYDLTSRYQRLGARGLLTGPELAAQLGVSATTVHTWGRQGLLQREIYGSTARCLYNPLDSMIPIKGSGGRHPKAPKLTTVSTASQEIV